jgi:cyclic nucleotide gated channel
LFLIIFKLTLNYLVGDPQIVVWRYLHIPDGPDVLTTKTALVWVVLVQYIPRLLRIFPVTKDLKRTAGVFIETAWAGAAYYLLWFMLAGHVSASLCFVLSSIISIFCSSVHVMGMKFISGYIISEILPEFFLYSE